MHEENGIVYSDNPSLEFSIVAWADGTIDCSPDFMYENGFEYNTKDIIVA